MKKISNVMGSLRRMRLFYGDEGEVELSASNLTKIAEKLDEVVDAINSMPRFTIIQDKEEEED